MVWEEGAALAPIEAASTSVVARRVTHWLSTRDGLRVRLKAANWTVKGQSGGVDGSRAVLSGRRSLVGQGLPLPYLVRRMGVAAATGPDTEETHARLAAV